MASDTAQPAQKPKRWFTLSEPMGALAILVLGTAFSALLFARPREVGPRELPSLVLPEAPVLAVIEADRRAAKAAPRSPEADAMRALLQTQGESEVRGREDAEAYVRRGEEMTERYKQLEAAIGEAAALRLRAESVEQMQAALDLKLPEPKAKVVLGAMPHVLERMNATIDGELVAPPFVVRTLFKVRWNILFGLSPAHRLEPIEKRAYFGWEALHADKLAMTKRVEALDGYAKAGGPHAREALGIMLYRHGEYGAASAELRAAHAARPSLRLRNYALGAEAHSDGE